MPKSIPTQGDLNWGTPLNAHIGQIQSPLDGGINKFEQFSQRPTNLTADDAGKTYLYTQTGNIHQWTGATWKVLNESVINVKDYGAVGDGIVDDTGAVAIAVYQFQNSNPNPSYGNGKIIHFPEGIFLVNMLVSFNTSKISGCGVIPFPSYIKS
jgi:Pectate lyase superfamily protein